MEDTILSHLISDDEYGRKVLPFLKEEYFHEDSYKNVFNLINEYVGKYNGFPTKEVLLIELSNQSPPKNFKGSWKEVFERSEKIISDLKTDDGTGEQWLVDKTEEFCKEKALFNAISESIKVIENKSNVLKGGLPELFKEALSVGFDVRIGHDFLEDWEERWESYRSVVDRVPFDLHYFNLITRYGFPKKTLNCFIAGTGVGKTLCMCHLAASNLRDQKNVLYITNEMGETGDPSISQRIDSNLLDVPLDKLVDIPKDDYEKETEKLRRNTKGKLIVKEYPTASSGAAHYRLLLNELRLKKNFIPDIIYVDYLNICISTRIKMGSGVNSYTYIKAIAEELRGLAQEYDVPVVTATQANRQASVASDFGMESTSESFGLPMTVDFMMALISTEEYDESGTIMCKQLKNRYNDPSINRKFVIGIDKSKMRLFDADEDTIANFEDEPVMDKTDFGLEDFERGRMKLDKRKFEGFH